MKKIIFLLLIIIGLALASIYIFFPATQKRATALTLNANQKALQRALLKQTNVYKNNHSDSLTSLALPAALKLYPGGFDDFIIAVEKDGKTHNSQLKLLSLHADSTALYWNAVMQGGNMPWQRVQTYLRAQSLQSEVKNFLYSLRSLAQKDKLYGMEVVRERVRDTVMVATRFATADYPQTADIYKHILLLQQYINMQGAAATNHPMLHVRPAADGYETMVAIPTSKQLPGNGAIEPKRMIMGNILMAEVKGGQSHVIAGMQQLENYVSDHGLVSPAIPFASLVTDRVKEQDSTKWITKLYYPIF